MTRVNVQKKKYLKPWIFGVLAGVIFVGVEAFFNFYPPSAYVFCLSCHTRDLINGISNMLFKSGFQTAAVGNGTLLLTSPFVLLGAYAAARVNKERSIQKSRKPILFMGLGAAVMLIGILIFGCPTRLLLRTGYGDLYALFAVLAMAGGIFFGTLLIKFKAGKDI
jgi:hypothetical protein